MKPALPISLVLALAIAPLSCKRTKTVQVQPTDEEGPRLAAVVHVSDPKVEPQLVSGFYAIEGNAWRWTAKQFTVVLRVPSGASQRGATLDLALTVPQVTIDKLNSVTLSGSVEGHQLPPETYTKAGPYHYKQDIPPGTLTGASAKIQFTLDKAMPPANGDQRELGIIVASIGLESK